MAMVSGISVSPVYPGVQQIREISGGVDRQKSRAPRMNTNAHESDSLDAVVDAVIGAAYEVCNVLGAGFLEKVYEQALTRELAGRGVGVKSQVLYPVV